jgi:hypothetical protein
MTARAQCAAVTLWQGRRVRCTVQTALRRNVVERSTDMRIAYGHDDLPVLHYVPVCSRHTEWIESHGWPWIDHEAVA